MDGMSKSNGHRVEESQREDVEESKRLDVKVRRFEELWIWQEARKLVAEIYRDFRSGRGSKDYGFRGQIQDAGVSIMNNIAEGFERITDPDFARFLDVAKGSCGEVRSMYYTAEDLGYIDSQPAGTRRSTKKPIHVNKNVFRKGTLTERGRRRCCQVKEFIAMFNRRTATARP